MKKIVCLFMALSVILCSGAVSAQECVTTQADKALAGSLLKKMYEADRQVQEGIPTAGLMVMAAKSLYGTPYVAGTLDEDIVREVPRIYLTKTDCIIFVETCLALARTVKEASSEVPGFPAFQANVIKTRYRGRPPFTYGDRVHYTTEWIRRQEGSLQDITLELGGEVYDHPIHFMTSNPSLYKQLADADNIPRAALALKKIREVEAGLAKDPMTYIPASKVPSVAGKIRSGDIICFVSSIEGLDIAHVAIALVEDGKVGFIHASQADGKVEKDRRTIAEYVARPNSRISGIKVVRPL